MSFSKINHMIFPNPKGKLQMLKHLRSRTEIKIHQHSSVITLLLGEWLTCKREVPQPSNKEEKAFHEKTTFPLTVWIYAPRESCISPLLTRHFHRRHSSPKPHTCGVPLAASQMTNYFWAYYQKSALVRGSGRGKGGRKRGWGAKQSLLSIHR